MRRLLWAAIAALFVSVPIWATPSSGYYSEKKLGRIQSVGATQFGGKRDPGVGCQGAGGDLCKHPWSFAELSNDLQRPLDFAALGHLKMHSKLIVCYKRCAVLEKRDVGAGVKFRIGHHKARIDLWHKAADYIGIDPHKGVAVVRVKRPHVPRKLGPVRSNPPTAGTRHVTRPKISHYKGRPCGQRTLEHGDRGPCVRDLQYLLSGANAPPLWRPYYARKKGQSGANVDLKYWRTRDDKITGHYGLQTIKGVQKMKYRLGYAPQKSNGAAGPNLRAYLLGRPLPPAYVDRKEFRYHAWKKASEGPGPRVQKLLALANQAIQWSSHYYYTQTSARSDFLRGIGPPWPKGGDCSGSVSALYWLTFGRSVPTGSAYPYDWTGSMQDRGHIVWSAGQSLSRLHQGDLVFYGYGSPYTHVAMVISRDGSRVYTFGNDSCPCNSSTLYRSDARIARRYF